jgi:hypothetical protein
MCRLSASLQKCGIFRKAYEGTARQENLGLTRPKNRFLER